MIRIRLVVSFLLLMNGLSNGYSQDSTEDYYLIEWEKFSPPTQEMIHTFENFPAEQFFASDINGKELFLGNFKGKRVIVWFWNLEDEKSISLIPMMNDLANTYESKLAVVSFADEPSATLRSNTLTDNIDFHIIGNGKVFGEAAYGSELGLGRMFLIDEFGIIQKVIPREAISDSWTIKNMIISILGLK